MLGTKNTIYDGVVSYDAESRLGNVLRAISDTGDSLRDQGVVAGFMLTVPEAKFREERIGFYPDIRRPTSQYQALMGPIAEAAVKHFDVVLRMDDLLCNELFCQIEADGQLLYYDSNHPSSYLDAMIIPHLKPQVGKFMAKTGSTY